MNRKNQYYRLFITFFLTLLFSMSFALKGNSQTLYSCESARGGHPLLHTIDPDAGTILTTTTITLDAETLIGCNGLARDPTTGVCWIILSAPGGGSGGFPGERTLATIDETTGVATSVGNLGDAFAGITFDSTGKLYGITGDGATTPFTLYIIDKTNALPSFFQTLPGSGFSGEAIAFNPVNGLIYHADGDYLESLNPDTNVLTQITLSGGIGEIQGFVHQSGNVLLASDNLNRLSSITITGPNSGVISLISSALGENQKGLAFDCGVAPLAPIPTLSEWGLIVMGVALGIFGLMAIRRKKVTV
jgi:hypothetical protein